VAATASLHGIPLVTHNRNDYSGVTALSIISEAAFEAPSSEETTLG
jgi:predicted nucleic acid-binding protein